MRTRPIRVLALSLCLALKVQAAAPTVGIEGQLEALLPGPPLHAKAADRTAPLTVRIASTRPHGTLTQYDFRYIGLVPGTHDLRAFLLREDGAPADDLPALNVQITGLLPEQNEGRLAAMQRAVLARFGGYRNAMLALVALWALCAIPLFLAHRRRKGAPVSTELERPPTTSERLRPLVEAAARGGLDADQQAHLERMLIGLWRDRLGLASADPAEAMTALRAHAEAGALLRALEDWLHRPPGTAKVDVDAILAPYREEHQERSLETSAS